MGHADRDAMGAAAARPHLRQNEGVSSAMKLSISSRPSTIAKVQTHSWKFVRPPKLAAGPTVPSARMHEAGHLAPRLLDEDENPDHLDATPGGPGAGRHEQQHEERREHGPVQVVDRGPSCRRPSTQGSRRRKRSHRCPGAAALLVHAEARRHADPEHPAGLPSIGGHTGDRVLNVFEPARHRLQETLPRLDEREPPRTALEQAHNKRWPRAAQRCD